MANNPFKQERLDYAKFHKTAEKQALPFFRKALAETIAPVLSWIENYGIIGVPVQLLIKKNVWESTYQKVYEQVGVKSARREYYYQRRIEGLESEDKASAIGLLIDVWSRTLRDYALRYTYQIQQELNDTTIEIINRALGEDYGLDIDRQGLVRLVLKNIKDKMKTRSLTISRTESTTVSNLGKDIGARSWIDESGTGGYKLWLGRVVGERPSHLDVNNTIMPIDDEFIVGGEPAERPGDVRLSAKERINCRCTMSLMTGNRYNAYQKRGLIVNGKVNGAS